MKSLSCLFLLLAGLSSVPLAADPLYTVTDLGTLGGSSSYPTGLNNSGQVVGQSQTAAGLYDAFLYSNGVMQDLGTLGGKGRIVAYGINNSGQVVGSAPIASGYDDVFLYSNGVMHDLGTLGLSGGLAVTADGINDSGQLIAEATDGFLTRTFLYSNGVLRDLGNLGSGFTFPTGLNNSGQVVGDSETAAGLTHAFLYSNGVMQDLGTLGGLYSNAAAINNKGQVVGGSATADGTGHVFLYSNGVMQDLGVSCGPRAINDSGQIVGVGGSGHAFLCGKGVDIDLNSLIDPSLGITLGTPYGINDLGQILVQGTGPDENGPDAYLLTPVPEPSSWALLGGAAACWLQVFSGSSGGVSSNIEQPHVAFDFLRIQ